MSRRSTASALLAIGLTTCLSACGGIHSSAQPGSSSSAPGGTGTGTSVNQGSTGTGPSVNQSGSGSNTTAAATNVTMPTVAGDSVPMADQIIEQEGLGRVTEKQEANLIYDSGYVITTDPAAGTQLRAGSTVILLVSAGPYGCGGTAQGGAENECFGNYIVPDLIGLTFQQADTLLAERGLTLDPQYESQVSSAATGTIIASNPAAGQLTGGEVSVIISAGSQMSPSSPTPSSEVTTPPTASAGSTPPPSPSPSPGNTVPASG
jgi:beta-lactam-binding protein with PASTA domain